MAASGELKTAHAAFGQGAAGERLAARHPRAAHRTSAHARPAAQGRAVLQRRRQRRHGVHRRAHHLRGAFAHARPAPRRGGARQAQPALRAGARHGCLERFRGARQASVAAGRNRLGRQVHRTARRLQVHLRIVRPRRGHERLLQGQVALRQFRENHPRQRRKPSWAKMAGILVAPGFGNRGIEGKIEAVRFPRARTIFRSSASVSACSAPSSSSPATCWASPTPIPARWAYAASVIDLMEVQKGSRPRGGTMRLGAYPRQREEGVRGSPPLRQAQRFRAPRHRYEEFSSDFQAQFKNVG